MMFSRSGLLLRAVVVAGLAACGGGGDGGGTGTNSPATVIINSGNTQIGAAGALLTDSMAVVVRDASGNALGNVTVSWAVASGGGSVAPATSTTTSAGLAKSTRTLGPGAGPQTATATVSGLAPVTFNAIAQIQGAVNIANAIVGAISDSTMTNNRTLTVLVTDHANAPVQGVTVQWAASGGGAVSAPSSVTSAAGQASVTYTYGATSGAYGATATVTGLVGSPVAFTLTGTAGVATQIAKTAGDNTTVAPNGQQTLTVTARDARNNVASGVQINWAAASGGGSVNPTQSTTGAAGTATTSRTVSGTIGAHTTTATAPNITGTPVVTFTTTAAATFTVTDNAFTPNSLTVPIGSTITWNWNGPTAPHNVTFAAAAGVPANEGNRTTGSITRDFNTAGTFTFQCTNHVGMTGQVMVTP